MSDREKVAKRVRFLLECVLKGDGVDVVESELLALLEPGEPVAWMELSDDQCGRLFVSGRYPVTDKMKPGRYDFYLAPQPERDHEALEELVRVILGGEDG